LFLQNYLVYKIKEGRWFLLPTGRKSLKIMNFLPPGEQEVRFKPQDGDGYSNFNGQIQNFF
tara:strand:+ start:198 stop:380 length:183 start_codon:yes stop_codon:yes gene_type:complete